MIMCAAYYKFIIAGIQVIHQSHTLDVEGSNPSSATINMYSKHITSNNHV